MIRKIFLLLFLFLVACSHTKLLYDEAGNKVYRTKCGGMFNDMSDCFSEAYSTCKGEFDIVSEFDATRKTNTEVNISNNVNIGSSTYQNKGGANAFLEGYEGQVKYSRYMIYKCKKEE